MIVLGIETAAPVRGVGLVDEERVLGEFTIHEKRADSESLFSSLDSLLKELHLDIREMDGISISIGPGSFTGLRVGLAAAKGFAVATETPLLSVPTLDALAHSIHSTLKQVQGQIENSKLQICPILDARKGEVYAAFYRRKGNTGNPPKADCDTLERTSDFWVLPPHALFEKIHEKTLFIGTGVEVYGKMITDHFGEEAHLLSPNPLAPSPTIVASLGLLKLKKGEVEDVEKLEPLYIRPSQVEVGKTVNG